MEKTKGTGAGGANTNKTGLSYENKTELSDHYKIIKKHKYSIEVQFNGSSKRFNRTSKTDLFKHMEKHTNKEVEQAHGCKQPDECYINEPYMFIIEKKFQQRSGSVCEKIQTADFKKKQYQKHFPDYKVEYIYCLSDWYKENCPAEIKYYEEEKNIPIFWGNSETYKTDIIKFMINYK